MLLISTIVLFSFIQSLFGMGLLVFGTPTLLLLGYSFVDTLNLLLPASLVVSFLQVIDYRTSEREYTLLFFKWCIPSLVVSFSLMLLYDYSPSINFILSFVLISSAMISFSRRFSFWLTAIVRRYPVLCMSTMGLVHGSSNLGGSILSIIASSRFDNKNDIRSFVAFCYLVFSLIQISILLIQGVFVFRYEVAVFPLISGFIYLTAGRLTFNQTKDHVYKKIFSGFMLIYGIALSLD